MMKKVAIITGATRGIGRSTAICLAQQGYSIVVNGTNEVLVEEVVQQIHSQGHDAIDYIADIADVQQVKQMMAFVMSKLGRIDVLIHNAGNVQDAKCTHMTEQQWHDVINVHLHGAFYCITQALPYLKEQGGDIVLMTSLAGLQGSKGQFNYSAAKAGLLGIVWTLANELQRYQIRVNAISPAALTDMTKPVIDYITEKCEKNGEPFPDYWKVGTPEDVAKFIALLLARQDAHMTGEIFGVNGSRITKWEKPSASFVAHDPEAFFKLYEQQKRK